MQEFRTVIAWQKAHALALQLYTITANFPQSESFGMTAQLRRAAINPPQRIAESCGRDLKADKLRGLSAARAALVELEYLILLARDLHLIEDPLHDTLHAEVIEARRTLSGFINAIDRTAAPTSLVS